MTLYNSDVNPDGLAAVPSPWTPLTGTAGRFSIEEYNISGVFNTANYRIVTFAPVTPVSTNIFIDGKDTGIKDFTYQGQSVSAILAGYATSAKNHGDYVSNVEKLVEKLLKAKLLTKAQAETLKQAAEKSSIGQKPKKKKEDKDDKGKSGKDKDD